MIQSPLRVLKIRDVCALVIQVEMEDVYNFNKGQADIATGLPDSLGNSHNADRWATQNAKTITLSVLGI